MYDYAVTGNLKHLPFFDTGETWATYEARFEEALPWLKVGEFSKCNIATFVVSETQKCRARARMCTCSHTVVAQTARSFVNGKVV